MTFVLLTMGVLASLDASPFLRREQNRPPTALELKVEITNHLLGNYRKLLTLNEQLLAGWATSPHPFRPIAVRDLTERSAELRKRIAELEAGQVQPSPSPVEMPIVRPGKPNR